MSSFARTIRKRALKAMGFTRQTRKVATNPDGTPYLVNLPRGTGNIIDPAGRDTGTTRWP